MIHILTMVAQRLALGLLTLLAISLIIFFGVELLPGDLATEILGRSATPETVAAFRAQLGLDLPAHVRYGQWLGSMLQGDMGVSLANQPFEHVDQAAAPVAQPEQGNPHGGQSLCREVKHGALELGRLHSFSKFKCVHGPCRSRCPPGHQATQSKQATLQELPSLHALKVGRAR